MKFHPPLVTLIIDDKVNFITWIDSSGLYPQAKLFLVSSWLNINPDSFSKIGIQISSVVPG